MVSIPMKRGIEKRENAKKKKKTRGKPMRYSNRYCIDFITQKTFDE